MISKIYDLEKNKNYNFFLFHGQNIGQKNEAIEKYFRPKFSKNIFSYFEKDVLSNLEDFNNQLLSGSFFEKEKLIIIKDSTDKIKETIVDLFERNIDDITILLVSNILDKKSKLRNFFEKDKKCVCVAFYHENNQILGGIVNNFFRHRKIAISQQAINIFVDRCRGDRKNLQNELNKIENYLLNKKKINIEEILKLTNLAENYGISELVDNCLAKNTSRTVKILNENNFNIDDCILIIRTFLNRSKRLLKLSQDYAVNDNLDQTITSFKPPIFWKEKDLVKQQMRNWPIKNTENLIFKTNEIELLIKKNTTNSLNILSDFLINQSKKN